MSNITIATIKKIIQDLESFTRPEGDLEGCAVNGEDYKAHLEEQDKKIINNAESKILQYITKNDGSLNKRRINIINSIEGVKLSIDQSQYGDIGDCQGTLEIERTTTNNDNDNNNETVKFNLETKKAY